MERCIKCGQKIEYEWEVLGINGQWTGAFSNPILEELKNYDEDDGDSDVFYKIGNRNSILIYRRVSKHE